MASYGDFNSCIFRGHLFNDPETKETKGDTKIVEFSLAVNKRTSKEGEKPNSLRMVAFNKTAEFTAKYLKKGSGVLVRSHVDTSEYTKENGEKAYPVRFIVDEVDFLSRKNSSDEETDAVSESVEDDGFINVPDGIEEELPFA